MQSTPRTTRSTIALAFCAIASVAFVIPACGSTSDSKFEDLGPNGGSFDSDGSLGNEKVDAGDLYANDPPPKYCVLAGQSTPPTPGGTMECPDDKNKPGCGCDTLGAEAACWTGLRVNRGLGQCKDGRTKCVQLTETTKGWGPCEGEVLPAGGQTKGALACKCFSVGKWKIANTSPCFISYTNPAAPPYYAVSTIPDPAGGPSKCPPGGSQAPPPKPAEDWSTDTLEADCVGRFTLCFELKSGDFDHPSANDCSLAKPVCVTGDYLKSNVEQALPNLPSWVGGLENSACATKWRESGGYAEMTVLGESALCDKIDNGAGKPLVFNRIKYCPPLCSDPANAAKPECQNCGQQASGQF